MNPILDSLNPQQLQAVTAGQGQILVLAGPGSGKTRVLTHRIAYLIQHVGVRPYNILAVTFTNKAAKVMSTRIGDLIGEKSQDLWLGTFHSVCARLLRREAQLLPFNSSFAIYDTDDQQQVVRQALKELNLDEKFYKINAIHSAISQAKNNLIFPDNFPIRNFRDEATLKAYRRYQEILLQNNALDFDDLLVWAVRLLETEADALERYAKRFISVLVDEFQDTNTVQYRLMRLLSSTHQNVFVVGDEDQSIYRWRGADYRNILRFAEDYPDHQKILLEQNYRSTQTVLDVARAVIDENVARTPKHLFSDLGRGERALYYEADNDFAEAQYIVNTIQQQIESGAAGGDFAVMYRTNAQSRILEETFLHSGMAYRLVGALRFYGRREVKDLIAYLRVIQNPTDEISLQRVINTPPRKIGRKALDDLAVAAKNSNTSSTSILLDLSQNPQSAYRSLFSTLEIKALSRFGDLFARWQELAGQPVDLPKLFESLLTDIGYQGYIQDGSEEGYDRWENVEELRQLTYEYADAGLDAFLENLALVSDQDTLPEQMSAPTLLTLHAAKGLEFDQVFIIGLVEGILPHSRSFDDPEEIAEERRLFYVGLTRAKKRIYLVRPRENNSYGRQEEAYPSRFLEDIPSAFLQRVTPPSRQQAIAALRNAGFPSAKSPVKAQGKTPATRPGAPAARPAVPNPASPPAQWKKPSSQPGGWSSPQMLQTPVNPQKATAPRRTEPEFRTDMRVRHRVWGEGLVLESRLEKDGEEEVTVQFESVGRKVLVASLAKLEEIV